MKNFAISIGIITACVMVLFGIKRHKEREKVRERLESLMRGDD